MRQLFFTMQDDLILKLSSWCRVFLKNVTVIDPIKKLPVFMEPRFHYCVLRTQFNPVPGQ
jgi:hypothetical protein